MSRPGGLKVQTGAGYGSTSPSLHGLAIITENQTLSSPDNIPGISIDNSFLTVNNQQTGSTKLSAPRPEISHVQKAIKIPSYSLCGARIAIYKHTSRGRAKEKRVATIGGVYRIGNRHFALTAAHVFFDDVASADSWADSSLYTRSVVKHRPTSESYTPKVSDIYEIIIESYWPNAADPDAHTRPTNISIGLVSPSVLQRRKAPEAAALPEVIWNHDLDWALIELTETAFWRTNRLHVSPTLSLDLKPPSSDEKPPSEAVIVAAGVSGVIHGKGTSKVEDAKLPWSQSTMRTWEIQCQTEIGDCGAMVIDPKFGTVYGIVISRDATKGTARISPASTIFESILDHYREEPLTLEDVFSTGLSRIKSTSPRHENQFQEYQRAPVVRSTGTSVREVFTSTLKGFSMHSIEGRRFIRRSSLVQWLMTSRRDGILHIDFMLDDSYPRNAILPVTSEQLSSGDETYLVIFSLLFELGRAELTHLFMRQGLTDNRLPFDMSLLNDAVDRMGLPDSDEIAREFFESQWAYCPMNFDLEMERDVPPHVVIPIHQRQQINSKGGNATLWQVTVLEEFVSKRLQNASPKARFNDSTDKLGYRYHFAVKSYLKAQLSHFETEVAAFKAFRTAPSMIGYLGNFNQTVARPKRRAPSFSVAEERKQDQGPAETYNILLEYGDYDLDEYFAATQPPVLPIQVTQFWQDIAGIAEAISEIHRFSTHRAGVKQEYSGWHADIKLDNILNVKGSFKLADPGFARVERSDKKYTRLVGGTKTFGCPEVHSTHRVQDLPVSQSIDIWSLGCVLSIAATWVVLGWSGVTQFQQLRMEALKRLNSRVPRHSRSRSRSFNSSRTSSLSVDRGRNTTSLPEGDCFHDGKKVLEEVRHWHNFLRSVVRRSDDVSVHMLDVIDGKMLVANPTDRIEAAELYKQMRLIVHSGEISNSDSTPDIVSQILLKTKLGEKPEKGMLEAPRVSAMTLSSARSDVSPISPAVRSSNRSFTPLSPLAPINSRYTGDSSSTLSGGDDDAPVFSEKQMRPEFRNIVLNEMAGRSFSSSIDIPIQTKTSSGKKTGLASARRMSVSEARAEVDKKKKVFSRRRKDPFLVKHLENRDIEFLVDNGDTMSKHWNEMKDLVEILCSLVSDIDKDGFDLSFTTGPVQLKQKSSARAVKSTLDNDQAKPNADSHTDMSQALDRVLGQLSRRLKSASSKNTKLGNSSSSNKNFTLIVLTDGVWRGMKEPHAVEDTIIRRMNEITRQLGNANAHSNSTNNNKRNSRAVTIQFIQFGRDEAATNRLNLLDQGLIDVEIPDIIDTEPSNGNVLKMLLGSVEASFDYADTGL